MNGTRGNRAWAVAGLGVAGTAAALTLLAVPPTQANSLYPTCPFKALTGMDCPLCGGLRGTYELLHGNLPAAADQNVFVPVLALGVLAVLTVLVRNTRTGRTTDWNAVATRVVPVAAAVLAVFWIVRNIPGVPFLPSGIG